MGEVLSYYFNPHPVENGRLAWEALQERSFDVVVSDVMMPELDGIRLAEMIKKSPELAATPVILVTARGGGQAAFIGLDFGADDYAPKPFAPEELCARVHAAIRMSRLQEDFRRKSREAGMADISRPACSTTPATCSTARASPLSAPRFRLSVSPRPPRKGRLPPRIGG